MKDNKNYVEVLVFSKAVSAQFSQSEIVNRFRKSIQPVVAEQEASARKLFPGTLRSISPIYLS